MNSKLRGRGLGIAGALLTLLAGSVQAEGPAIGGYVDTQYNYNFTKPAAGTTNLRSYDSQDNNIASTAHLALTGKLSDEVSYAVEIDAGSDADTTSGSGEDVVLQEGYVVYTSPSKFGFKAGKFATFQGIEVIESVANPTISRGFLYGLAEPFTHVGGVLTYALEKVDFAAGVVNGWDQQDDANEAKTWVGKAGFNFGDPLSFTISGYYGAEQASVATVNDDLGTPEDETVVGDDKKGDHRTSIDLTGVTKIIPNVDLWFQTNYGYEENTSGTTDDKWMGFTVQPVVKITEKVSLGFRYEYFYNDEGSRVGGTDNLSVSNVTFTPAYKLTENVLLRAEVRHDMANEKVFTDDKGTAEDTNTTGAFQVAVSF